MAQRTVREIIGGVSISAYKGVTCPGSDGARDIIQELWSEGWTFTRRAGGDPFAIPVAMIPEGMAYQWSPSACVGALKEAGWNPVPASRHDGYFAPVGYVGDIEVSGLTLVERPRQQVEDAHRQRIAGAEKNVTDWAERTGAAFTGSVSVLSGGTMTDIEVGARPRASQTRIPPDLIEHAAAIFAERDKLKAGVPEEEFTADRMAALTERAIANVRASVNKETAA